MGILRTLPKCTLFERGDLGQNYDPGGSAGRRQGLRAALGKGFAASGGAAQAQVMWICSHFCVLMASAHGDGKAKAGLGKASKAGKAWISQAGASGQAAQCQGKQPS